MAWNRSRFWRYCLFLGPSGQFSAASFTTIKGDRISWQKNENCGVSSMGLRGTGIKQTAGTTPSPEPINVCHCSTVKVSEFAGRTTSKPREWRLLGSKSRTSEVHRYSPTSSGWTVARVCDVYLADLHLSANPEWAVQVGKWLNDLCGYCGALKKIEFKKKHLRTWLKRHSTWNHNTQRNVIGSVIASFNYCCKYDDLDVNPVAGYEKPSATRRVTSFTPEAEKSMYETADDAQALCLSMPAF